MAQGGIMHITRLLFHNSEAHTLREASVGVNVEWGDISRSRCFYNVALEEAVCLFDRFYVLP